MAIDFSDKRVTMVVCPVDGRYGFLILLSNCCTLISTNKKTMLSLFPDPAAFAKLSVPMNAVQHSSPAGCTKAGLNVC